jgi:hypothetical protein
VGAIGVIIVEIVSCQVPEMDLMENDDVVEQVVPKGSDPLTGRVLGHIQVDDLSAIMRNKE